MTSNETQCPNCGQPVAGGKNTCGNCGLNLVTGESYESKLNSARKEPSSSRASRVGGLGLAIGFGLVILAGFMYQRSMMTLFRQRPDEIQKYVKQAHMVQYLVDQSLQAETMSARQKYRKRARALGQGVVASLEATEGSGEKANDEDTSESNGESREVFLRNLRRKVEYHLGRLPKG